MARCGCAGTTCGCRVTGLGSVTVEGTGTAQDPYVISLNDLDIGSLLEVDDTTSIGLTLLGAGTDVDPYVLSADLTPGATVTAVPTNGGTTLVDATTRLEVLSPAGTIATHTVTMPATTDALESEVKLVATAAITLLTVDGAGGTTVVGAPTTLAVGAYFTMRKIGSVWRRIA